MRYLLFISLCACIACNPSPKTKGLSLEVWPSKDYRLARPSAALDSILSEKDAIHIQFEKLEKTLMAPIFDALGQDIPGDIVFRDMTPGQKSFYTSLLLMNYMYNQGLVEYFWGSSSAYAHETVRGFRLLGEGDIAKNFEEVVKTWEVNKWKFDRLKLLRNVQEASRLLRIDWFEDYFFEKEAQLMHAMIHYVRSHPAEFFKVDDESKAFL